MGACGSKKMKHVAALNVLPTAEEAKPKRAAPLPEEELSKFMHSIITGKPDFEDPFYVLDLGMVVSLMEKWTHALPAVRPFYAVKCNPQPTFLSALAALGASFDCASLAEIEAVLSLGVTPDRIVFANPCKPISHIKYAAAAGVNLTTFDSVHEVDKIRKHHPKCSLLIRIKPPEDGEARCPLGTKYGALPGEVEPLLKAAQAAQLNVVGVAFHIGSGASDSAPFRGAIRAARDVFHQAACLGMPGMQVLDVGGGFTVGPQFEASANTIKSALGEYFEGIPDLQLIAEPGRFFAEGPFTLAANIVGKRVRGEVREYWLNDGLYGSMNCLLYDHATVHPTPFAVNSNRVNPACRDERTFDSTVFGPTCDALDTISTDQNLPELEVNDWMVFRNMGAYTAAAGSNFNGFNTSSILTHIAC